jgi:branched-chain amino acid transport system ATP-binding protein
MSAALATSGLSKRFGSFEANTDIDLNLQVGARQALIGPNGAGKTTLINLLSGFVKPSSGQIWLNGADITHLSQHQRVKRGMTRTFQINTLFPGLSVLESLILVLCEREHLTGSLLRRTPPNSALLDEAFALMHSLRLADCADSITRELPYGRQRLLEIGLSLASRPSVLLLDEPAAGIPAEESLELFEVLGELPSSVSILLIEHDMDLVFRFASRITVLVAGRILTEGSPAEVQADDRVREVYLGLEDADD